MAAGAVSAVSAARPYYYIGTLTLKIGHHQKKALATEVFKISLKAESGWSYWSQCVPSGQLGGETELVHPLKEGNTLAWDGCLALFAKVCKEAAVLRIPYLFPISPKSHGKY